MSVPNIISEDDIISFALRLHDTLMVNDWMDEHDG